MGITVQKFGGTSVSTHECRIQCIRHIKRALSEGEKVVVVVSAMGRQGDPYATDTLLSLVEEDNSILSNRERDLLLSTGETITAAVFSGMLNQEGIKNKVLTGGQAGIVTDNNYNNARIISLKPSNILQAFECGEVVIVPGFQGETINGEVTTLGRGGSDTSATAIGASIDADLVEIYTDVEGIMTADPRIVKDAAILKRTSYTEICNLAQLGAKVVHPRAVEIAMQKNIPLKVRSTFSNEEGTLVTNLTEINRNHLDVSDRLLTGITNTPSLAQFNIETSDSPFECRLKVFQALETNGISVDFINVHVKGVTFTVPQKVLGEATEIIKQLSYDYEVKENCAKISLVGAGMSGVPGVISQAFEALGKHQINILQSSDSHTTIWFLVEGEDMKRAIQSLHSQFLLNKK